MATVVQKRLSRTNRDVADKPVEDADRTRPLTPQETEWKQRINEQLLTVLDLSLIDSVDTDKARKEIREIVERLLTEAKDEGVRLDAANLAYRARSGLRRMIDAFADAPDDRGRLRLLAETARIVRGLPFHVDVRETENRCYALSRTIYAKRARRASNDGGHEAEWTNLFRDLAETLRIAVDTPDSS